MTYEPLAAPHAQALFPALADPRVNEHIGRAPASVDALSATFARMAAGPSSPHSIERWVNFAVRDSSSGDYIGRLEATCHGTWAEVAYLFGVAWWGKGYATEAMHWFCAYLLSAYEIGELWAAVAPENLRSLALLARLDFRLTAPDESRVINSYESGDVCFRRIDYDLRAAT